MATIPSLPAALPRRLNLGCGRKRLADCLNVDVRPHLQPDLVWDLNVRPYPLPRAHFEQVFAFDVVEHLADVESFVAEAHALLAPGGVLEITTPHFSNANSFTDPTHHHHLGYFSFDYFTDHGEWNFYDPQVRFEIAERLIVFAPGRVSNLFARWANRHPRLYEQRLTWMLPAWFLRFRLRAVKTT